MFARPVLCTAACAALLSACLAQEPAGTGTVGPGYVTGGGEWSSGGGITAVAALVDAGGQAAVCGAWTTDRQSTQSVNFNEDVMATGSVFAGGRRVVSGLGFMRRVSFRAKLTGETTNCVLTGLAWDSALASAEVQIRFPRQSYGDSGGSGRASGTGGGGGSAVRFRQTPRPDAV